MGDDANAHAYYARACHAIPLKLLYTYVQLPDDPEVTKKLKDRFEANVETMVTLLKAMGHEQVIDMKDASAN